VAGSVLAFARPSSDVTLAPWCSQRLSCGAAPTAGADKISNILPIGNIFPISNICPIGNIFPISNICPIGSIFPIGNI
jgi:hypothetical protein